VPAIVRWIVASLATSIGATLGTLPWSALLFQSLAPLGFVANLVAVPLSGCAVPLALSLASPRLRSAASRCAVPTRSRASCSIGSRRCAVRSGIPPSRSPARSRSVRSRSSCAGPRSRSPRCAACVRIVPANVLTVTFLGGRDKATPRS
jgi:hypothetical protein